MELTLHRRDGTLGRILVDDDLDPVLAGIRWADAKHGGYAWAWIPWLRRPDSLHRLIALTAPRQHVDHRNGDVLDDRRCNLRVCSTAENIRNRTKLNINNSSGTCGVRYEHRRSHWIAEIVVNRRRVYLGRHATLELATAARRAAELLHFGDYAPLKQATTCPT